LLEADAELFELDPLFPDDEPLFEDEFEFEVLRMWPPEALRSA
jgi:hypothetical protein